MVIDIENKDIANTDVVAAWMLDRKATQSKKGIIRKGNDRSNAIDKFCRFIK
jgi:hypothetical protein